jgi:hypothetical protein
MVANTTVSKGSSDGTIDEISTDKSAKNSDKGVDASR